MTAIASSPATVFAPTQARRPPWGVFPSIGFVAVGWVVRGPLLAYAPLHALVQAAHHNLFSFSALDIIVRTASFLVIAGAVWLKRWPLAEYLNFRKPRAKDVALGIGVYGIQPHIIESILNHQSGFRAGVAGIYNRASYDIEKRTALDRWATHLLKIVEGGQGDVIQLLREA